MSSGVSAKSLPWDWHNIFFLSLFHILAVGLTITYFMTESLSWSIAALAVFFYLATGLSITAGYHRLFSHRGYECHPAIQLLYLIFGAAAFQNSALKWCTDHRIHHRHVDKDKDPYNINEGFWYAHIGWVLRQEIPKEVAPYQRDLVANKLVMWQHRNYVLIGVLAGIVLPTLIGWALGSWLGGLAIAGFLRLVLVHHFTFFINSLAHYWGKQTFTDENTAKDNFLLAFVTYGEGFHNFHHLFHNDYRNGIRWFDFDPTKWAIKSLSYTGLTWNLKTTPSIRILQAKMLMREKRLAKELVSSDLKQNLIQTLESWRLRVEAAHKNWGELKERYKQEFEEFKKVKTIAGRQRIDQIREELRMAKAEFKQTYAQWRLYSKALVNHQYGAVSI